MAANDNAAMALMQRSFTWEYFGGRDFNPCDHGESDWRRLPFMVVVCPAKGLYYSQMEGLGRFKAKPGEALLVPKGRRHTVAIPNGGAVHYAHIQFNILGTTDVLSFFKVPPLVTGKSAREIADTTRALGVAFRKPCHPPDMVAQAVERQSLAFRLLGLVASAAELAAGTAERLLGFQRLEAALKHMESHLAERVSRAELARLMGLSETRFHYVFTEALGSSPLSYFRNLRMQQAQLLLFQTDLQVAAIGARVGYPDLFHFSKAFKQAFGVSPSEYRQETRRWVQEGQDSVTRKAQAQSRQ
jgi:AraC-like DNA-binding protein